MVGSGPIKIVRHVVFARPDQLYRFANRLATCAASVGEVGLIAPSEAAAHISRVNLNLLRGKPVTCSITSCTYSGPCAGAQASARSAIMCTVQFIGSMVACA